MDDSGLVVLVTGGNGFVGQHIVKLLHEKCEEVKQIRIFDIKPYKQQLGKNIHSSPKEVHMKTRPNFLSSLGHRPRPRVTLILSIGLESNSQKTMCQNLNGVFCILLSRPLILTKIDMTLGQGQ